MKFDFDPLLNQLRSMPLFTHESAVAAGIKSGEARRARSLIPVPGSVQPPLNELEKEITRDTLEELRRCRDFLRLCRDPELFVKLTAAKERLYNLIFPRPGVRKPVRDDRHRKPPSGPIDRDWQLVNEQPQQQSEPCAADSVSAPSAAPPYSTPAQSMAMPVVAVSVPTPPESREPARIISSPAEMNSNHNQNLDRPAQKL